MMRCCLRRIGERGSPHRGRWALIGTLGLLVVVVGGCGQGKKAEQSKKPVEVVATTPITDQVTDYQDFTGHIESYRSIDIRARVDGYVTETPFTEGAVVEEGQVLFKIDPRPYEAAVEAAEAQLASAKAQLEAARAQIDVNEAGLKLARIVYARAKASGSGVSHLELDQSMAQQRVTEANLKLATANLGSARASLGTAEANLATARLNLMWTTVKVPHDPSDCPEGKKKSHYRVSRYNIDPGNVVQKDMTILTTLVIENPTYAYFDVDERSYLRLVNDVSSGASNWFSETSFPVLIRLAHEDDYTHMGEVDFRDNRLNANTGTLRMRGKFQNATGILKSGLFVRVRLPIGKPTPSLLIPDEALMSDQGRKNVYVLKRDKDEEGNLIDKVEYRAVTLGQSIKGLRVIKDGLAEGDRVIVAGMQKVRPGAVVRVKMETPPEAPKSSLTRMLNNFRPATPSSSKGPKPGLAEDSKRGDRAPVGSSQSR